LEYEPNDREVLHPAILAGCCVKYIIPDPLLLATISAVPVVGDSITQVLTWFGQEIVQERNKRLFQQLSEHLEAVDEQAIKKGYFETEEGFDLLIKALDESRRTRSEEKRDLIARILAGATLTEPEQDSYSTEDYLYLISDLTIQELRVARLIYEQRPDTDDESWNAWEAETCATLDIDKAALHLALARLRSTGLLQRVNAHEDEDGRLLVHTVAYGEIVMYMVTANFDKLMEFLRLKT
jgi:DNA-binding MarR family transcriptional regulator